METSRPAYTSISEPYTMFYNKMGAYCDSLLNRDKHFWTEEETDAMLELYELNSRYFNDPKTKKTKIWSNVYRWLEQCKKFEFSR